MTEVVKRFSFIQLGDGSSLNPPRLILSANPAANQVATIEILAEHSLLTTGSDTTTIPDRFIHLIGLFVRWKCWQRLASEEAADPDPCIFSPPPKNSTPPAPKTPTAAPSPPPNPPPSPPPPGPWTATTAFIEGSVSPWNGLARNLWP